MPATRASVPTHARYAAPRQLSASTFSGSKSSDYCNSFWGVSDAGPRILFARMQEAMKTTDELRKFWHERCLIEEEYAEQLAKLAKMPIGGNEIGELRTSLDMLRSETKRQAETHFELANQMSLGLDAPTATFHERQRAHLRNVQNPIERKFKRKQAQDSHLNTSRETYEADCLQINSSYARKAEYAQCNDQEKMRTNYGRSMSKMIEHEKNFAKATKDLLELAPAWEKDWKEFCDSCQDLEEERMIFMKDILWAYSNDISTMCVADDQSCEGIRAALNQLEPEKEVENFANEYGAGNIIVTPPEFQPSNEILGPKRPSSPIIRKVDFQRVTDRIVGSPPPSPTRQSNMRKGSKILFHVKALYDYTATTEDEFDFQAGDIIAVTAAPHACGKWKGKLLDKARRVKGRNMFPSNFVRFYQRAPDDPGTFKEKEVNYTRFGGGAGSSSSSITRLQDNNVFHRLATNLDGLIMYPLFSSLIQVDTHPFVGKKSKYA